MALSLVRKERTIDYKIYRTPCNAAGYIVNSKEYGRYAIEAHCPQLEDCCSDCPCEDECEFALAKPKSVTCVNGWDEADKLLDQDELNEA